MSGVRGSCVFCAHWPDSDGCLLPGYACLDHEPDKPQWSPTLAAQIALRLEEDLADARAELERNSAADLLIENARLAQALRNEQDGHQPEERVGRCGCGWHEVVETVWCERIQTGPENEDWEPAPIPRWLKFCPRCGWELDHETGVARRNADAALLDALERMVLGSAEHGEEVELDARHEGHGVLLVTWPEGIEHHRAVLRCHCYAHGLVDCTSMPGDRAEDIDRIGHGESLPARAVYRTFTITRRGRKVVRDETREEPEHRG